MRIEQPKYIGREGEGNYGVGMIGFSFNSSNLVSQGIVIFTDTEEFNQVDVSHSFYVVDAHTIIEAGIYGVIIADPEKYFNNPHIHVFFRKPIHLNSDYVQEMTEYAFSLVGKGYDWGLFLNFLWQWFKVRVVGLKIDPKSPPLLDSSDRLLCSEVTSETLNQISEYQELLPLREWHSARISPMLLVHSKELFEPWGYDD